MEKTRKDLKIYSILILAFAVLTLVMAIVNVCVKGFPMPEEIPEGMTKELVNVVTIVAFAISLIMYLPQIYLGLKGLKIAKEGTVSGKAPMVWAIVLAIFAVITTISGITTLVKTFSFPNVVNVLEPAVDVLLYVCYYLCVKKIAG